MNEDYIRFDPDKLRDVVHFICARCQPDELGNVKLHKILYFADMMKFVSSGQPLTGVDYIKQQFGPTARYLTSALSELGKQGLVRVDTLDYFGFEKKRYVSLADPDTSRLSNEDIQLLSDVMDLICARSAKEISELSHDVAWRAARMGERIPYAAALALQPTVVTDDDLKAAKLEARRIRPQIEADRRADKVF